jgi:hypothetical protein
MIDFIKKLYNRYRFNKEWKSFVSLPDGPENGLMRSSEYDPNFYYNKEEPTLPRIDIKDSKIKITSM